MFKEVGENQTYSNIRKLNVDERVDVLAIMLSQDPPSKGAIENAKELLGNSFIFTHPPSIGSSKHGRNNRHKHN